MELLLVVMFLLCFFLGIQEETVIEIMTKIMTEDGFEVEKNEDKSILTGMIIGGLMNTTVGVMRMTPTIEIIRGGWILPESGGNRFLQSTGTMLLYWY
jgi:hypothetical protein